MAHMETCASVVFACLLTWGSVASAAEPASSTSVEAQPSSPAGGDVEAQRSASDVPVAESSTVASVPAEAPSSAKASDNQGRDLTEASESRAEAEAGASTAEGAANVGAREGAVGDAKVEGAVAPGKAKRSVFLEGLAQFRQLLVVDEDPAAERALRYVVRGGLVLDNGLRPFVRLELWQRFYTEVNEQLEMRDMSLGAEYAHKLSLDGLGLPGRTLSMLYRGSFYLPTSRKSLDRDLVIGPDLLTDASFEIVEGLAVGAQGHGRYQWYTFADRAGPGAGYNTQLSFDGTLRVVYTPFQETSFGSLSLGADVWVSYDKRYPARPEDSEGRRASSVTYWDQGFGWDLFADYAPIEAFSVQVSVERGGRVNRDGIVNPQFLGHRDEIEMVVGVAGHY
ncbi:MAG: hypothetical protein IPK13_12570 [Deltaproteobacteria bacterium]|nr:hypothetical protein [Deltaproteobacteria bacterium]